PSTSARVVTTLSKTFRTPPALKRLSNVVLVIGSVETSQAVGWYHIRLAKVPNNTTGWVRQDKLGPLSTVNTHLYVNRRAMSLILKRDGRTIFETRLGIGSTN